MEGPDSDPEKLTAFFAGVTRAFKNVFPEPLVRDSRQSLAQASLLSNAKEGRASQGLPHLDDPRASSNTLLAPEGLGIAGTPLAIATATALPSTKEVEPSQPSQVAGVPSVSKSLEAPPSTNIREVSQTFQALSIPGLSQTEDAMKPPARSNRGSATPIPSVPQVAGATKPSGSTGKPQAHQGPAPVASAVPQVPQALGTMGLPLSTTTPQAPHPLGIMPLPSMTIPKAAQPSNTAKPPTNPKKRNASQTPSTPNPPMSKKRKLPTAPTQSNTPAPFKGCVKIPKPQLASESNSVPKALYAQPPSDFAYSLVNPGYPSEEADSSPALYRDNEVSTARGLLFTKANKAQALENLALIDGRAMLPSEIETNRLLQSVTAMLNRTPLRTEQPKATEQSSAQARQPSSSDRVLAVKLIRSSDTQVGRSGDEFAMNALGQRLPVKLFEHNGCHFCDFEYNGGVSDETVLLGKSASKPGFCGTCSIMEGVIHVFDIRPQRRSNTNVGSDRGPATRLPPVLSKIDGKDISRYMPIIFCEGNVHQQVDITKARICKGHLRVKLAIIGHRHIKFHNLLDETEDQFKAKTADQHPELKQMSRILNDRKNCMICTNLAEEACDGCPLLLCVNCDSTLRYRCKGWLDNLFYYYGREHLRNDAFLLRGDGGGY